MYKKRLYHFTEPSQYYDYPLSEMRGHAETAYLLNNPENRRQLLKSIREYEEGRVLLKPLL